MSLDSDLHQILLDVRAVRDTNLSPEDHERVCTRIEETAMRASLHATSIELCARSIRRETVGDA